MFIYVLPKYNSINSVSYSNTIMAVAMVIIVVKCYNSCMYIPIIGDFASKKSKKMFSGAHRTSTNNKSISKTRARHKKTFVIKSKRHRLEF